VSDEAPASWSALVAVYQAVLHDLVRALEHDAGIDSGMFSALAHLQRAEPPGRLPLAELQRLMHPRYSQPGLSRLVKRMETHGLVERRVDAADGRATTVHVTRAGRARYKHANTVYTAAVEEHFLAFVTAEERDRIAQDLGAVTIRRTAGANARGITAMA
jgi:DNA-binding MarR family transcriptional regulator